MLEEGDVKLADMRSSWAGAMGLTQLMPTDYFEYAVDVDGDGRRDIWNSVPDALAAAAQTTRRQGLAARCALGPRGASAGRMSTARWAFPKTPARSAGGWSSVLCRPMAAKSPAPNGPMTHRCCSRQASTVPPSSPPKLFCHQGIQFLRPLRAVRRPSQRPHPRSAAVRDAVGQGRAAADPRPRAHAANPHRARLLPRQDRRQGRDENPRRARRLSEAQPPQGRLLADRDPPSRCWPRKENDAR